MEIPITVREFGLFQRLLYELAGVNLGPSKQMLVAGRLAKRLKHYQLTSYGEYYQLIQQRQEELRVAVDLLTTHETYFFREPRHFEILREQVFPGRSLGHLFRFWSAACSSGEEVYSAAMVLAESLGQAPWEVLGSDIATSMLDKAQSGLYPLERMSGISKDLLHRYCLKGIGPQQGNFRIDPHLCQRIRFMQINLNENLPAIGEFDVIFLRNILIYFDQQTKHKVIEHLLPKLRSQGWLFLGHSESLAGMMLGLRQMAPSVYRKS